jgi:phosphatidylinositol 4-kinase A
MLAPHSRVLQFFASHYNATRLGNTDTQKTFLRLLNVTLDRVKASTTHPMAREIRFRIVLFGLKVLKTSTTMAAVSQMRLKDKILSAALSWFSAAPSWSFGSNMLQLKTEIRLLGDVMAALKGTSAIGANAAPGIKSLQPKEQLLTLLLESEQAKLTVWVHPLAEPAKSQFAVGHAHKVAIEASIAAGLVSPPFIANMTQRIPSRLLSGLRGLKARHWLSSSQRGSSTPELRRRCAGCSSTSRPRL